MEKLQFLQYAQAQMLLVSYRVRGGKWKQNFRNKNYIP